MHLQESGEMYLETIYVLSKNGVVRSLDVAEYMGFSKPSVSRAVGLLKQGGYLIMDRGVFVEAGLTNYRVDPSQGTHFFQNLTSFGVGYFTINAYMKDGIYNQEVLDTRPAIEETRFIRHVRFDKPLIVKMDGKKKLGVVMLPE